MRFKTLLNLGLLTCLASQANAAENLSIAPQFSNNLISSSINSGDGCPSGSTYTSVSDDSRELSIAFTALNALATYPDRLDRKVCNLSLNVDVPRGYQVAFSQVDQDGYAYAADQNSLGTIRIETMTDYARYPTLVTNRRQAGPFDQDYRFTDQVSLRDLQWTDCNSSRSEFNIRTEITAQASQELASFQFAGAHNNRNETTQRWRIDWRRCDNMPPPSPTRWLGQCNTVLETVWGTDIRDYWGQAYGRSERDALYNARDESVRLCEGRRNNDRTLKCTFVASSCTATPRN